MATYPKIVVTNPTGVTSITDGLATFPIVLGSYPSGLTRDGVRYVVAPNGIEINEPTPVYVNDAGRLKNGTMLNPARLATSFQALDNGENAAGTYDATKRVSIFPVRLEPGDVLVKGVSTATPVSGGRTGILDQIGVLHVVASAPAANAFAAPVVWPSAEKATRPWRTVDVDARLSELPSLSPAGQETLPWAQLAQFFDKFELGKALTIGASVGGYEWWLPKNFNGTNQSGYDGYQDIIFNAVYMGLMLNEWSTADKTAALIRVLQHGCQRGETMVKYDISLAPGADGGHHQSQYGCAMAWLWATGRQDQYATWIPKVGGSYYYQSFKLTSAFLATCVDHTDITKPHTYRRRPITSVTGSTPGLPATIVVEAVRDGGGPGTGDSSRIRFDGLNLKRVVGAAGVAYTTSCSPGFIPPGTSSITITIDAQPATPFAVSDTVIFEPPHTLVTDSYDFCLADVTTNPNFYNPSHLAEYRDGERAQMITHLWTHAIGMHGSLMTPSLEYCKKSMLSNTPAGYDYVSQVEAHPPSLTGGGSNQNWQQQFYNAHSAYLLALPQDV